MKMIVRTGLFASFISLLCLCAKAQEKNELRIGDQAPLIKAEWLKGQQVSHFKQGNVYVLEFWATWCGPCIKAMPHISALAKKYSGKVAFVGISVWERGKPGQTIHTLVKNFVDQKGDTMSYNVGMDGADAYMVENWLQPAAISGIPCTFIIGKDGMVSWIGHPMEMDEPLAAIIKGTFDRSAFAAKYNKEQVEKLESQRQQRTAMKALEVIEKTVIDKDYKRTLSLYDSIVSVNPVFKNYLIGYYLTALANENPDKAYSEVVALKDSGNVANLIAQLFSKTDGLENRFYEFAIEVYKSQPDNVFNLDPLSAAYFHLGMKKKAVDTLQKFLDVAKTWTSPLPASYLEKEISRLQKYKESL